MPTIKLRRTTVVLFQGDDYDLIEEKLAAAQTAARSSGRAARLGDDEDDLVPAEVKTRAAEYDAAVAEAVERGQTVLVEALPRKTFRGLVVEHPPREDNDQDANWGFNYETLCDALVPASLPLVDRETAEAQFGSEAERQEFLESLSDGDFSRIYSAAIKVNQGGVPDPKASLSSRLGLISGGSSEQPARLG
jgi:hypothetical protein